MTISKACKELIIVQPFYGFFLLNINKEYTTRVPTLAVSPNGVNIKLLINEKFWNSLNDEAQLAVLTHEINHVCFFHLQMQTDFDDKNIFNYAADAEVNCYINNLPEGCVTVSSLNKELGLQLEERQGTKEYYKVLIDFKNKCQKKAEEFLKNHPLDNHETWKEFDQLSNPVKKLIENQIKAKLKEAEEATIQTGGSIPGEMSEILKNIKDKPPVFNWKRYFRRLIGNSISSEIQSTRMRPSKRFPDAKGIRLKRKPNILVGVDTSGSVSMDELNDFFSEINHIYRSGVEVTVVECDTQINNIFKYTGKHNIKIGGRGGTILNPIIEYYNSHKEHNVCIIFTDGELYSLDLPKCNHLIWVITSNGNKVDKFPGKTIYIP